MHTIILYDTRFLAGAIREIGGSYLLWSYPYSLADCYLGGPTTSYLRGPPLGRGCLQGYTKGLEVAREIGMICYRSPEAYRRKFGRSVLLPSSSSCDNDDDDTSSSSSSKKNMITIPMSMVPMRTGKWNRTWSIRGWNSWIGSTPSRMSSWQSKWTLMMSHAIVLVPLRMCCIGWKSHPVSLESTEMYCIRYQSNKN
jgi:hypothetical protein